MNSPRRVLADKPTNISIRKQDSSKNFVRTESLDVSFGSALSHSSEGRRSSHKRRFDEMAGEQEVGESQDSTATQQISLFGSQNSNTSLGDDADTDSRNLTRSTAPTTMISFQVSQTEPNPMETEFEIHEEMSQQTLDKIVSYATCVISGGALLTMCSTLSPFRSRHLNRSCGLRLQKRHPPSASACQA